MLHRLYGLQSWWKPWSVCVHSHSLDSLQEAYSVIDLIWDFAEDVFKSSGLLIQVLELLLRSVNHELCRGDEKTKQKNKTHTQKKRCLAHPQRLDDLQHLTEHLNIASKVRLYRKTTQACTCTDISTIRCMKIPLSSTASQKHLIKICVHQREKLIHGSLQILNYIKVSYYQLQNQAVLCVCVNVCVDELCFS